ncbi:MAG: glycoside hydrolase family 2 TIM barrel-domain containing protein [Breznakibacter sp.]
MCKLIAAVIIGVLTSHAFAQSGYTINEAWKFKQGDHANAQTINFSDKDWECISLPHTWNADDATDDKPGYYRGVGWYRKTLFIGNEANQKVVYIYFGGANQVTKLYVNDQLAGTHIGGYSGFVFDITPFVKIGEQNLLAVKVDNSHDEQIPPLSADFTFFGGIYRNVSLSFREPVGVSPLDHGSSGIYIAPFAISNQQASVSVKTLVRNASAQPQKVVVEQTVFAPGGQQVAQAKQSLRIAPASQAEGFTDKLKVISPMRWSPATPKLYSLRTRIIPASPHDIPSETWTNFGIRTFDFSADKGFAINGNPLKLIGTNRHQCFEDKGWALADEIHIRDLMLLKEMGGNFLRVSHYPQDPLVLEMCDKLGIVASVEIPVVNAVTPGESFLQNSLLMASEMVRQAYNHPSVIIWAYMNEVMLRPPFRNDAEKHRLYCAEVNRQAQAIETLLRQEDPARLTMIPFHGALSMYEDAGLVDVPHIVGWNLYQGWYGGTFDGFGKFMDDFHKKYPHTPTIITEYGADVDDRLFSFLPARFDYTAQYANAYHEHYLKAIMERPFIAGANIWNLNDFYSEARGDAIPHKNGKGINGIDRRPKDTYLLYKTHFNTKPMVYLGSRGWTTRSGIGNVNGVCEQPMKVYSNQPNVEISLNGTLLGKYDTKDGVANVTIPFINGENLLTASAKGSDTMAEDAIRVQFRTVPDQFSPSTDFIDLNVMLGSDRYFHDEEGAMCWIPEKVYEKGSWGFVGGERFLPKSGSGTLPASALNIKGTDHDPIFQTQRMGIESFKLDVPDGKYAVYLYWAELVPTSKPTELAYNLGNNAVYDQSSERSFHVNINGNYRLRDFDITREAGVATAIIKRFDVQVRNGQGIDVRFEAVKGEPVLNAIRVVKVY